jgi:adenine-specific DNA-methyltransferase
MTPDSLNLTQDLIDQLKIIIPTAFSEGKLDVKTLKNLIGEEDIVTGERYELNWPGKANAYKVLQRRTTETLVPSPEDSINWDKTGNVFIEGENLAVLKVLQKSYYGKIKMIYIDPPYNTGSDSFIYPDKFSETREEYAQRVGTKDEEGYMMKDGMFQKNTKDSGHYHSNWLNMIMPRLHLARNLMTDDGVIFVSIDDHEQANLKLLMDQIFGEENFIASLSVKLNPRGRNLDKFVAKTHEYVLLYTRDSGNLSAMRGMEKSGDMVSEYNQEDEDGKYRKIGLRNRNQAFNPITRPTLFYPLFVDKESGVVYLDDSEDRIEVLPETTEGVQTCWTWGKEKVKHDNYLLIGENTSKGWRIYRKDYLFKEGEKATTLPKSLWTDKEINNDYGKKSIKEFFGTNVMSFPKSHFLLKKIVDVSTYSESITLDFFSGSGTLGQAVLDLNKEDGGNRKFICVQLPEKTDEKSEAYKAGYKTISAIAETRIRKVIEKSEREREGELALEEKQILGFRKFTLQDSNFKLWRGDLKDVESLKTQMQLFVTPEKEGSLTENILWELLVKNGKLLTESLVKHEVDSGVLWSIQDGSIAFALNAWNDSVMSTLLELKPQKIIALDSVFDDNDAKKSNAQLQCEDANISFTTV